jgi:hypothetical protein
LEGERNWNLKLSTIFCSQADFEAAAAVFLGAALLTALETDFLAAGLLAADLLAGALAILVIVIISSGQPGLYTDLIIIILGIGWSGIVQSVSPSKSPLIEASEPSLWSEVLRKSFPIEF